MSKTIVCGVDFTHASEMALDEAIDLAAKLGTAVDVLHVYAVPSYVLPEGAIIPTAEDAARIADYAQKRLDELVASRAGRGVVLRSTLRSGSPWEEIVKLGDELEAEMIAVGTHARGPLKRALLGSVASKVIRTGVRPVLTVPERTKKPE